MCVCVCVFRVCEVRNDEVWGGRGFGSGKSSCARFLVTNLWTNPWQTEPIKFNMCVAFGVCSVHPCVATFAASGREISFICEVCGWGGGVVSARYCNGSVTNLKNTQMCKLDTHFVCRWDRERPPVC